MARHRSKAQTSGGGFGPDRSGMKDGFGSAVEGFVPLSVSRSSERIADGYFGCAAPRRRAGGDC